MFTKIFYGIAFVIAFAQATTIVGNLLLGNVHGSTIWMVAPITVLCFGILAIIETINRKRE